MKIEDAEVSFDTRSAETGNDFQWREATRELNDEPAGFRNDVGGYVKLMMEYNQSVNVISRKTTPENLGQLINETALLYDYISPFSDLIIDAGSGNGILGIPVAFKNKKAKVALIEPRKKKCGFLRKAKEDLSIENLDVFDVSIEEFLKTHKTAGKHKTLISRGFPHVDALLNFVRNQMVQEAVIITSENKLKNITGHNLNSNPNSKSNNNSNNNSNKLDSYIQKTYKLPLRDHLLILKFERNHLKNSSKNSSKNPSKNISKNYSKEKS